MHGHQRRRARGVKGHSWPDQAKQVRDSPSGNRQPNPRGGVGVETCTSLPDGLIIVHSRHAHHDDHIGFGPCSAAHENGPVQFIDRSGELKFDSSAKRTTGNRGAGYTPSECAQPASAPAAFSAKSRCCGSVHFASSALKLNALRSKLAASTRDVTKRTESFSGGQPSRLSYGSTDTASVSMEPATCGTAASVLGKRATHALKHTS
jgi:hypothetical protein